MDRLDYVMMLKALLMPQLWFLDCKRWDDCFSLAASSIGWWLEGVSGESGQRKGEVGAFNGDGGAVQTDKGIKRWRRSDQMTKPTTPNKWMTGGYSSDSKKTSKQGRTSLKCYKWAGSNKLAFAWIVRNSWNDLLYTYTYLFFSDQILNFEAYRIYVLHIEIAFNINPVQFKMQDAFKSAKIMG